MTQLEDGISVETLTNTEARSGYYPKYKVIIHNDDKTTMEFVVKILAQFFNKDYLQAVKLMMEVHERGHGLAGVYPKEQAEFRIDQATSLARGRGFPLTLTMEKE
jgi:ATP-dependent Clp protease adaptor protein ClpS